MIPRTTFHFLLAALITALISISVSHAADKQEPRSRKPNVVIFYTGDQGTLDAHCYGSKDLHTPVMDKLAKTGTRFMQAYAHTVCCPSRAMLLTGRYPQRGGVTAWTQANAKGKKGRNMSRGEITLAEVLKGAGYSTALFGKWHLVADFDHGPTEQGFDQFLGLSGGFIDNYKHYAMHGMGFHDLYEGKNEVFAKDQYFPDLVTERAVKFINKNKGNPFFLYVAFNIPHYPEQADAKFDARYKDLPEPRRSFAKMISTTDDRMGQILNQLENDGLSKDTIILFMSDNGHSPGNYQVKPQNHSSGLPHGTDYAAGGGGNTAKWRCHKNTFFEGGIRVPAIISAMDWMPTLLELCDLPLRNTQRNGKILITSIHKEPTQPLHTVTHWAGRRAWAGRAADWKLIENKKEKS